MAESEGDLSILPLLFGGGYMFGTTKFSGYINEIVRSDGSAYESGNWRLDYQGFRFNAEILNSEVFEGKVMVKFYGVDDPEQYIRTGAGILEWNKDLTKGVLVSTNSRYYFTRTSSGIRIENICLGIEEK